ncbi:MAG TPA: PD-(D/E)XK nuclease family protein, partial [Candidatus Marinimicrobia bacterium]|nr:PD-(D/E)XK nuclease family protein [Candidatus Neomarinimicrobiota bacterium]
PDLLWEQVLNNLMMGLRNFVEEERRYCPTGFAPILTEKMYALDNAFLIGNDPTLPVTITGKIDRIDHNASGKRFLVIDYKRSSSGIIDIVNGAQSGTQFQIPLYLLILLKNRPNEQVGGAFYYSFKDGKRTRGFLVDVKFERTPELGSSDLNELLNKTQENVTAILEQIYRGNFNLLRRNENRCRGNECDFYDLCRIASGQKNSHQQPATHSHQKRT